MTRPFFMRWTALCALAECLGIGAAAAWYGAMNAWLGEPVEPAARLFAWLLLSFAAIPEGLILGGLQAKGLRWVLPSLSPLRWILATIAIGLAGWGIGSFIPLFMVTETMQQTNPEPGLTATILFACIFGLGVGGAFGLVQSFALPTSKRTKIYWILFNALGWALALPAIYIAAGIAADYSGWLLRIALWAAGGAVAGLLIGMATGLALCLAQPTSDA